MGLSNVSVNVSDINPRAKNEDEESGTSVRNSQTPTTSTTSECMGKGSESFPVDGGTQGWICVAGGFFALLASFGWLNCLGFFQTYYEKFFLVGYSASSISWIFTTQLFFMWSGGAVLGRIIDTYGTRHIALICTFGCGFCVTMLSLSTAYYQIMLSQGVGFGIFASGLYACGVTSVGQWFHKRKALALGIVLAGGSSGAVIHSLYLHFLIPKIGFPNAIRVNATVIFTAGLISCALMRTRLPRKKWDAGAKLVDLSLFKDGVFATYCVGTFLVVWGLFSTWAYLPTMSLRHDFSLYLSTYTIVILNASSTLGRIIPAHFADRFGRFSSLSVITLLNAVVLLAFWLPIEVSHQTTHAQIFALSAVAGFSTGACIGLFMPCAAELGPVETLGSRFGLYQTVIGLGGLTGLPIQGALIPEDDGSFAHLIIFSGICILAGSLVICGARMLKLGRLLRGEVLLARILMGFF